jgi:hypothetical protein
MRNHDGIPPHNNTTTSIHHATTLAAQLQQFEIVDLASLHVLHITLGAPDDALSTGKIQMAIVFDTQKTTAAVSWCHDTGRGTPAISVATIMDIRVRERVDPAGFEMVVRAVDKAGVDHRILFSRGLEKGGLVSMRVAR